jgi:hypothetical protein
MVSSGRLPTSHYYFRYFMFRSQEPYKVCDSAWPLVSTPHLVAPLTLYFHFLMVFRMAPSVPLTLAFLFTNPADFTGPLSEIGLGVQPYRHVRHSAASGIWIEWRTRGISF